MGAAYCTFHMSVLAVVSLEAIPWWHAANSHAAVCLSCYGVLDACDVV